MKLKDQKMANKGNNNKENKTSGVKFTGGFWVAPDGRKFNNRLKAELYVLGSGQTEDSNQNNI